MIKFLKGKIMKKTNFIFVTIISFLMSTAAFATEKHDSTLYKSDNLIIKDAFIRYNVGTATGAFLTIENIGSTEEKLLSARAPISKITEIHNHIQENGVMMMRKIDHISIPAQSTFYLKPGAHHIMLINLTSKMELDSIVDIELTFENEGTITVPFKIQHIGSKKYHHGS